MNKYYSPKTYVAIASLLVLLIVGGVVWYREGGFSLGFLGPISSSPPSGKTIIDVKVISESGIDYVTVSEFGVMFPADKLGKEISYRINEIDGTMRVEFKSEDLAKMASEADADSFCDQPGSLGSLIQSRSKLMESDATDTSGGFLAQIGEYYYYSSSIQNSCSTDLEMSNEQSRLHLQLLRNMRKLRVLEG